MSSFLHWNLAASTQSGLPARVETALQHNPIHSSVNGGEITEKDNAPPAATEEPALDTRV